MFPKIDFYKIKAQEEKIKPGVDISKMLETQTCLKLEYSRNHIHVFTIETFKVKLIVIQRAVFMTVQCLPVCVQTLFKLIPSFRDWSSVD